MEKDKKPFLCKIGFHRPYTDSAFFNNVERRDKIGCDWVSSKEDAELLAAERKAWGQTSNEGITDFHEQLVRVMKTLTDNRGK